MLHTKNCDLQSFFIFCTLFLSKKINIFHLCMSHQVHLHFLLPSLSSLMYSLKILLHLKKISCCPFFASTFHLKHFPSMYHHSDHNGSNNVIIVTQAYDILIHKHTQSEWDWVSVSAKLSLKNWEREKNRNEFTVCPPHHHFHIQMMMVLLDTF